MNKGKLRPREGKGLVCGHPASPQSSQAETHDSRSRGHVPPPPSPSVRLFQPCLLQRKSRDPSAHKNPDCTEFRKPLRAGWGPCCNSVQLLVLFFFFSTSPFSFAIFPISPPLPREKVTSWQRSLRLGSLLYGPEPASPLPSFWASVSPPVK